MRNIERNPTGCHFASTGSNAINQSNSQPTIDLDCSLFIRTDHHVSPDGKKGGNPRPFI